MQEDERYGCEKSGRAEAIIVDYGGANVAKPLHVGHLRSAVIGESVKRMSRYIGHEVIGDVHLGDWGLQMGLIITELKERKPELVYLTHLMKASIRRKRRLLFLSWRRSIRQPVENQKKIRLIKKRQCRRPLNFRKAEEDILPCGNTFWQYPSRI